MKMNGSANGGHDEEVGVEWWVVVTKYIVLDVMLSPSVLTCPGFVVHCSSVAPLPHICRPVWLDWSCSVHGVL